MKIFAANGREFQVTASMPLLEILNCSLKVHDIDVENSGFAFREAS
jgi:hypothetical protein